MTYTERVIDELKRLIIDRRMNVSVEMDGLSVVLSINGNKKYFTTPKLAKIYLETCVPSNTVIVDSSASGIVSQKNDETLKKRRGRPKKADNDRARGV